MKISNIILFESGYPDDPFPANNTKTTIYRLDAIQTFLSLYMIDPTKKVFPGNFRCGDSAHWPVPKDSERKLREVRSPQSWGGRQGKTPLCYSMKFFF